MSLPIFEIADEIRAAVSAEKQHCRIVVEAPTGSGKSTQVPQILLDSGLLEANGEVIVLQPRRLAARMLARRVAFERGCRLGDEVGYQVRFENAVSSRTRIRYVTEGILIRRLLEDPKLKGIAAIVFDEFHERHFFGDISLAKCCDVQETVRPDLKLLVMSATLEISPLLAYLGDGARHVRSEGRSFPVEIEYCPAKERHGDELWDHTVRSMREHFRSHPQNGHSLIFMPGRHEIRKTVEALKRAPWTKPFSICELFGELPPDRQDEATAPSRQPKIVVATNIAETSITIDGVTLVVDSGLERRASYDPRREISTLHIEKISRASADQRTGRAGRTVAGRAIRLWSERDHHSRSEATPPEIHRMDLAEAALLLKASGVSDVRNFRWFEKPDAGALERALSALQTLGAIDEIEELTPTGWEMSRLPVTPRYGRILVEAAREGCLPYFAVVTAAIQSRPFFLNRKGTGHQPDRSDYVEEGDVSDFQPLCRAWLRARQARFERQACDQLGVHGDTGRDIDRIARQLIQTGQRLYPHTVHDLEVEPDASLLGRILLTGFSDRLAKKNNAATLACQLVHQRRGQIEKTSVASKGDGPFVAAEIIEIEGKEVQVKLDYCTCVSIAQLREIFPGDFSERNGGIFNEAARKVEGRIEQRFLDLVITSKAGGEVPDAEAAQILAEKVIAGDLTLKHWDRGAEEYVARINLLAVTFPESNIPLIDEDAKQLLIEQICRGARSYKEIKERHVLPTLQQWIPAQHYGILDRLAPERITLGPNRNVRIIYGEGQKPKVSVMIQHLFGIRATPTIGEGRIPLVVEILAPNQRPVQVTEDLAGFWKGSYAAVRAQLRGRYPKHDWPEPEQE